MGVNYILGPYVVNTMGKGWCVRIDGSDIFEEENEWGTKARHTLSIVEGLDSKEDAEKALAEWLRKTLSLVEEK